MWPKYGGSKFQEFGVWQAWLLGYYFANLITNVTGVLTDVNAVTALLHKYGALAVWDYATAGPYVQMDMNPPINDAGDVLAKDAIIFSIPEHSSIIRLESP